MRIAVVQFSPKIGRVLENMATAERLCEKLKPGSVDLVCLPEMVFTGYVFPNATAISPFLEKPREGPTSRFCAALAARLHCHVAAGYPERLAPDEEAFVLDEENEDTLAVGANSAVLYGPNGAWVGGYRKTNLFETDKTWAKPGTGFATFDLARPLNTVALGICMDLNVQAGSTWMFGVGPYEIADHCIAKKANLLVLLNAWLDSGEDKEEDEDMQTLNYWAARLRPLWAKPPNKKAGSANNHRTDLGEETIVVICNRSGEENGKTFAGTSAMFRLRRGSGRPILLHAMQRRQEGVEVWSLSG
ncbi:carbon-nitrogen hydrolase [Amylocystis lapponica]|nr:carbon-nitrogen hydrolase [Amylocystis lapponica]